MYISFCLAVPIISFVLSGVNAFHDLTSRDAGLDTCADVDAELKIADALGIPIAVGLIDACICISALPSFIQTNVVAEAAVLLFGEAKAIAALTALIDGSPDSQQCTYPANSSPECLSGHPCFFTCQDGYTASPSGSSPTNCVCVSPKTVCNGQCGSFTSCASGNARRAVSDWARDCQAGTTACPVPGRGRSAWECVNTMTDLESCGGCIYPSIYGPTGVDCAAIEGVSDVACQHGRCVVHRCMPGYKVDTDGSLCVNQRNVDILDILAAEFGLEHTPL